MDGFLMFISNLVSFTEALLVISFWIFVIVFVIDEVLDLMFGDKEEAEDEDA